MTPEQIDAFERDFRSLVRSFELYFLGMERIPPLKAFDAIKSRVQKANAMLIRNTGERFRFQNLIATYLTYASYWERNLQRIEDGTFHRDVFKANLANLAKQTTTPAISSAAPATPQQPHYGESVTKLYNAYLQARKECKLPTENVAIADIHKLVTGHYQTLKSKYADKKISFRIEIKDNKPVIKAVVS